jgi:DNA (cytosine-5)-methyltransferase 1
VPGLRGASVAWKDFGWKALWFSQFDPEHNYSRGPDFPSKVLAYHYPDVPNLGDMTLLADKVKAGVIEAPEVIVGGTPCTSFSLAGLKNGLNSYNGQLTLEYVKLINAIDSVRFAKGQQPCIAIWENVPGVLSDRTNAFGCLLAGLIGATTEVLSESRRWESAGVVYGEQRVAVWRVFDAQYFGVPQRRRRVFLVTTARKDAGNIPAILFEQKVLRRHSEADTEKGIKSASKSNNSSTDGCYWDGGQLTQTLDAVLYKGQMMPEKRRFPVVIQDGRLRRLTVVECERAQGFPDNYTNVPNLDSKRPASDTQRLKAIGNSFAVPCVRWIGNRVKNFIDGNPSF